MTFSLGIAQAQQIDVIFVKGSVIVKNENKKPRLLNKGDSIGVGARIQVQENGLVVLKETDGSTIKLEGGTLFEVTTLQEGQEGEEQKDFSLYSLARGAAFFFTPKNEDGSEKMRVRTKSTSFAVRGTEFFIAYGEGEGRENDIWMCVRTGLVESLSAKSKKGIVVKANEGIQVSSDGEISPPKFLPWTSKLNWNNDPEAGELENRVSIEEAYASPLEMDFD